MHKLLLLITALVAGTTALSAQKPTDTGRRDFGGAEMTIGRFYGTLLDDNTGKKVEYASIRLMGMRWDSITQKRQEAVLGGQLTGENGEFSLEKIPLMGEFTLKITCIGYEPYESLVTFGFKRGQGQPRPDPSKANKDLGNIRLKPANILLKETEIVGEAAGFSLALDKKIFKMDKNLNAAGGTAEDALKNVPSLSVDIDGNLTLRNAAPQIFVDGRPTNLSLDQIPADAIDNVELITNPSAKYDASGGSAGIVNIVLKKERRIGYNGSVRAGIDKRTRPNIGADINAREGKFNAFLSGNLNFRRSLSTSSTDRHNLFGTPRTNVFQNNDSQNDRYFLNGRTGVDWFINNRNTITFAANINGGNFSNMDVLNIQTDTLLMDGVTTGNSLFSKRNTDSKRRNFSPGGQILYKKLFPVEGRELTADINFNSSVSSNESTFATDYFGLRPAGNQRQSGTGDNQFYTIQSDYTTPLGNGMKVETGVRAAIRAFRSDNETYQRETATGTEVRVNNFADEYGYLDQVYAAYGNFSKSYKRWGYQAGVRLESSKYEGDLPITGSQFGNQYPVSFFPSIFTTYKLNEADNLQFNYSRRVNRPSFFQLIPFSDFSDSLLLSRGNPELLPEFTNAIEVSWQNIINRSNNFLATAYFRHAYNLITRYQFNEFNEFLGRDAIVSSYQNANSGYAYGMEFTIKNTVSKIVDFTTNANFFNSVVNAENIEASLKAEQFSWSLKENLSIRLPKEWVIQINGEYSSRTSLASFSSGGGSRGGHGGGWRDSPTSTAQGYRTPVWSTDFSIRKSFFKKKASVTLSISDLFRSNINGAHSETASFIQDTERLRDPQFIRLNFSYRFGKFDTSLFKRKNTRESGDGMEF